MIETNYILGQGWGLELSGKKRPTSHNRTVCVRR
jgi:hypothetical protein